MPRQDSPPHHAAHLSVAQARGVRARTSDAGGAIGRALVWGGGLLAGLGIALAAGQALSQEEDLIESHGYSTYGELAMPADFAHLAYVNPDAPKGGEISIWSQGTFDNMNPYATKEGRPGALSSIGVERLMQAPADEVGSVYCYLCTTIEYPEDRSFVIFNMRPDVTFSDGTPMTAHDVVFSHNLLIEQGTLSFSEVVGDMIPLVEALDDTRVKFTFSPDYSPTDTVGQAGATPVFSQAWYEETGARLDESRLDPGPGSGPYMLGDFDINRRITYVRNPNFWGADHPLNLGRYNFDSIRVEYFADTTAAFEAFKGGEFTFRIENSSLTWATGYDFPALNNGWVVRDELPNGSLPNASGFVFNLAQERLRDVRVRRALALMFNFTWTNETLQYGLFEQRTSFWEGSDLQAQGVPEGLELELLEGLGDLIDPAILTEEVTVPHVSGDRQLDRPNLRAASALLEEAGWVPGDDGLVRRDGQTLDIEFLSDSPSLDRILIPYIDNLQALGVNATYNRVDPAQYTQRTNILDFDMIFDSYTMGLEEGESLSQRFGSSGMGDIFNPASYENPAVEALVEKVSAATTREEMAAAVRAIDRIMRRDMFIVPVWYNPNYWTAYFDMYRHPDPLPPYALGYLEFWWYDAEAAERLRAQGAFR